MLYFASLDLGVLVNEVKGELKVEFRCGEDGMKDGVSVSVSNNELLANYHLHEIPQAQGKAETRDRCGNKPKWTPRLGLVGRLGGTPCAWAGKTDFQG